MNQKLLSNQEALYNLFVDQTLAQRAQSTAAVALEMVKDVIETGVYVAGEIGSWLLLADGNSKMCQDDVCSPFRLDSFPESLLGAVGILFFAYHLVKDGDSYRKQGLTPIAKFFYPLFNKSKIRKDEYENFDRFSNSLYLVQGEAGWSLRDREFWSDAKASEQVWNWGTKGHLEDLETSLLPRSIGSEVPPLLYDISYNVDAKGPCIINGFKIEDINSRNGIYKVSASYDGRKFSFITRQKLDTSKMYLGLFDSELVNSNGNLVSGPKHPVIIKEAFIKY